MLRRWLLPLPVLALALSACTLTSSGTTRTTPPTGATPTARTERPAEPAATPAPLPSSTTSPADESLDSEAFSWQPGVHMAGALSGIAAAAAAVEAQTSYGFDDGGSCLLGAYLNQGQHVTLNRAVIPGESYVLLAKGSEGTVDVDIYVETRDGTMIARDAATDAGPVVQFIAPNDAVSIHVSLFDSGGGSGRFVALAILRDGGFHIPTERLANALFATIITGQQASDLFVAENNRGLVFHEASQWSFLGTILRPGESVSQAGLRLEGDVGVIIGGSDGGARDLDLLVEEPASGRTWRDTQPDAVPVVIADTVPGEHYAITLSHPGTTDGTGTPALATFMVLRPGGDT